jgi:hypothetical protein
MDTYTLEVIAPFVKDPSGENEEQLSSALEAVATTHGGIVIVEHSDALARLSSHRRYVNVVDCAGSFEKEVEWLRERFPDARFAVKELLVWTDVEDYR